MPLTLEEFKERLGKQCDPDTFVDILEIDIDMLMSAFEYELSQNLEKFEATFDIYGEDYDPR